MKRFPLLMIALLAAVVISFTAMALHADSINKETIVTFNEPTQVPGITLPAGTYVFKLVRSDSNRHIVAVMNQKGDHLYALTFAAAAAKVQKTGKLTLTFYEGGSGHPPAVHRWFWPGEVDGQEFIYPKTQAAEISIRTKEKVPEGEIPTVSESGQSLVPDNASGH